jgi:hypothetical protein
MIFRSFQKIIGGGMRKVTIFGKNQKAVAYIKYARIYDLNDQLIGRLSGSDVIDHMGKKRGSVSCLKVYDQNGRIVGYANGTHILDAEKKIVGSCIKSNLIGAGALLLLLTKR